MTTAYLLTERALDDLDKITEYTLERWGEDQVITYLSAIYERLDWLVRHPHKGRNRPEVHADVLCYREGSHLIFYRIVGDHIEILAILHQAVDINQVFG